MVYQSFGFHEFIGHFCKQYSTEIHSSIRTGRNLLLLRYTDSASTTTSSFGVLTANTEARNNMYISNNFTKCDEFRCKNITQSFFLNKDKNKIPPVVTKTTMSTDFLKPLKIFTKLVLKHVRCNLHKHKTLFLLPALRNV